MHNEVGSSQLRGLRDDGPVSDVDEASVPQPEPLLAAADVDRLRTALADYTVDGLHERFGLVGRAALERGDLAGVRRAVRELGDDPVAGLASLFLLGDEMDESAARRVLDPLPVDAARSAGLVDASAGRVRGALDLRPYAEDAGDPWWVVSDFGSDVRPGPLARDHVLGIGAAALTLAQATPRDPVGRALDLGTGCGIQALHLHRHAGTVVATDISARALRLAATTSALSGQRWDLRAGSLLGPVAGERFDLVVANPPFIVGAGGADYDYRDSGLSGDGVCRQLVSGLPGVLAPGGTAQLLANWIIPAVGTWQERVGGWIEGRGCDAWVWQREIADPAEYIAMWLRDAGETPGSPQWVERYDAWADWFVSAGVAAVGMGMVTLWRTDAESPSIVLEDVPQVLDRPIGRELPAWVARQRWLAARSDDQRGVAWCAPATTWCASDRTCWTPTVGRRRAQCCASRTACAGSSRWTRRSPRWSPRAPAPPPCGWPVSCSPPCWTSTRTSSGRRSRRWCVTSSAAGSSSLSTPPPHVVQEA